MNADSPAFMLNQSLLERIPLSRELACAYFADRISCFREFRLEQELAPELFDALLELGYRRCGDIYYQTQCPACTACRSYRLPVADFRPRRSQRRVLKRNTDVELRLVEPVITPEKQALYLRYQLQQHHEKELARHPHKAHRSFRPERLIETMELQMYTNPSLTRELQLFVGDTLIGFGTLDLGRESVSAVYFVFDPEFGDRSLGTLAILRGVAWAAANGYRWYHLGYYIAEHDKMNYKKNFTPAEVYDPATGDWLRFDGHGHHGEASA